MQLLMVDRDGRGKCLAGVEGLLYRLDLLQSESLDESWPGDGTNDST